MYNDSNILNQTLIRIITPKIFEDTMFIILDIILNLTCGSYNIIRLIENEYYLLIIDLVYKSNHETKYKK